MTAPSGEGIRTTVSVRRERLPRSGPTRASWQWDDVLGTPPPPRRWEPREGTFIVRHGFDDDDADPLVRVGVATVVTADPRPDRAAPVRVDERLTVEPRVLGPVLAVERAVHRRVEATGRKGAALVTTGSERVAARVGGRSGAAITRSTRATVGVTRWAARSVRDGVRALVEAPDRLWASASAADALVADRHERRALVKGLWNPHALSREGKSVALFLVAATLLVTFIAVTVSVTLARPELAGAWRAVALYFGMGVGGTLLFPFFPEFRFASVAAVAGPVPAALAISLGMVTGAWMVLFLGDEIHGALRRAVRPGSPLARGLDKAEAFAARYGFWAAFVPLSVPLAPDTPVFYTLATVRTPLPAYLLGTFLGTLARFTLWYTIVGNYYIVPGA